MTKTRLTELQKEIERLEAIDKAITERVEAEFNSTHTLYIDENGDAMEFLNSGGDPLELNQSNESLIARHNTKLSSEFIERESEELPGMFIDHEEWEIENGRGEEIEIPCSLALDMQMANESENIM